MSLCDAYLLKGWLLAERAPAEIMDAIGAIIANLAEPRIAATPQFEITGTTTVTELLSQLPERAVESTPTEPTASEPSSSPAKPKRNWSPEARAAAAERLKNRQAEGLMKGRASTGEAHAPQP